MSKQYLVTGGTGFIGAALVKQLLKEGHRIRILDDNSRGNSRRLTGVLKDVEMVHGDVRNFDDVDRATKGVDIVAHLAFVNGTEFFYSKPRLVLEVGVKGAIHTLDAAIKHGVPEYFLMSSSEVYQSPPEVPTDETVGYLIPDPLNPRYSYGGGKIISELLTINYGREAFERALIVRPHNVYGPDMGWEHVIPQLVLRAYDSRRAHPSGRLPLEIQGDGSQTRAFVYIDDFVAGTALILNKGQHLGIYHVGTQDELSIRSVAETVVGYFQREPEIIPGPATPGATVRRCPDITKVRSLGYRPAVGIKEGVGQTAAWYVENRNLAPHRERSGTKPEQAPILS